MENIYAGTELIKIVKVLGLITLFILVSWRIYLTMKIRKKRLNSEKKED